MYRIFIGHRFHCPAWSMDEASSIVRTLRANGHDARIEHPRCVGCSD